MLRGDSALVACPTVEEITRVAVGQGATLMLQNWMFELGSLKLVWLKKLNASNRNWKRLPSLTGKLFMTAKSKLTNFGPVNMLRPTLPMVPGFGGTKTGQVCAADCTVVLK